MARTVSVIIPAYNASEVISTSLASVAGQTMLPDEVIVVDDGSTDDTSAVVSTWKSVLPVRALRLEQNLGRGNGAGGARHQGILDSRGDVIALLDADDVMLPDHLEVMLALHARNGGLVTANHLLWQPGAAVATQPISGLIAVPPAEQQRAVLFSENFVFIGTVFDRSLYDAAGGFRSIRCEDWDLWIRMVETGARVSMPDQVTALYRGSVSSVSAGDKLLAGDIDLLTELLDRVHGQEREIVDRALRRRRAKQHYLDGIRRETEGDRWGARRAWLKAATTDLSFRRNNSRLNGNVALRAAACFVAPERMLAMRSARQASPHAAVGQRPPLLNDQRNDSCSDG